MTPKKATLRVAFLFAVSIRDRPEDSANHPAIQSKKTIGQKNGRCEAAIGIVKIRPLPEAPGELIRRAEGRFSG
jgi:hypothetical protein